MPDNSLRDGVNLVRRFNRRYTQQIGLLNQGLLESPFSLTQARILFELSRQAQTTAKNILSRLNMDPGYLSRILTQFEKKGLLTKNRSENDCRQVNLALTPLGRETYAMLSGRSDREAERLLLGLSEEDRYRLLRAMMAIESVIGPEPDRSPAFLLRLHEPGDIGWVIHRHGVVYAQEHRYDETFEALVAEILVQFIREHNPQRERLWIAEQDGRRSGSVMVVEAEREIAQLRLLFVDPDARAGGIGRRLIDECLRFAKSREYRKIKLWTQSDLYGARRLYAKAGFKMVESSPHQSFGRELTAEFWELPL